MNEFGFIDYYAVLNVNTNASKENIKKAYKKEAIKWHPDKNRTIDTTKRMKLINEAYVILYDDDARRRYDIEYKSFIKFKNQRKSNKTTESQNQKENEKSKNEKYEYRSYEIKDDILYKWIQNARKQAVELVKLTVGDFKEIGGHGLKEGARVVKNLTVIYVFIAIIVIIYLILTK